MARFFVACVGVVLKQDKILLVKEGKDAAEDSWALPGGSLEPNEKLESCVEREIKEETGIETEAEEMIGTYVMEGDAFNEEMFIFAFNCQAAKDPDLDIRDADSVQEAEFVDKTKLDSLNLRFNQIKEIIADSKDQSGQKPVKYL